MPLTKSYDSVRARRFGDFMEGRLPQTAHIKRWDGAARTSDNWDKLKQDPELWDRTGTCLVYLSAKGTSRRRPAFKIPLSSLLSARCHPLIERYCACDVPGSIVRESSSYAGFDMWYRNNPTRLVELYIPAPRGFNKSQAMRFHLATRNFFAWICRRSLVGAHLGGAIVTLMGTMQSFRLPGTNNLYDLLDYLEEEGYLNMQNLANHALAILYVSEHFEFREMYIDAFAHCVGMNNQLFLSSEYRYTSSVSQKLIRRARADYDVRLHKTSQMLQHFLSDEFSEHHLGLTLGARHHFERFREFLMKHYTRRFGQYPPPSVDSRTLIYSKDIYNAMRTDFECLYELLVDNSFTAAQNTPFLAQGGICTVQCVNSFDLRCRFKPLSHPLPKLPQVSTPNCSRTMSISSWLSRAEKLKPEARIVQVDALKSASNSKKSILANPLVAAFRAFEEESVFRPSKIERKDKLSLVDARKVRWILVYGVYQSLRSITQPPIEVREIDTARYLLAVSTADLPPWKEAGTRRTQSTRRSPDPFGQMSMSIPTSPASIMSEIQPDIDYLAPKYRNNSAPSALPSHGRDSNVGRAMSLGRSFAQGEMFRRLSIFKNPKWHPEQNSPPQSPFHEIVISHYGNGTTNKVSAAEPTPTAATPTAPSDFCPVITATTTTTQRPSTASASILAIVATTTASRSHSTSSNSSTSTTFTTDSYSTAATSVPVISPRSPKSTSSWDCKKPRTLHRRSATYVISSGSGQAAPVPRTANVCEPPVTFDPKNQSMGPQLMKRPTYNAESRSQTMPLRIQTPVVEDGGAEWEMYNHIGGHTPL